MEIARVKKNKVNGQLYIYLPIGSFKEGEWVKIVRVEKDEK